MVESMLVFRFGGKSWLARFDIFIYFQSHFVLPKRHLTPPFHRSTRIPQQPRYSKPNGICRNVVRVGDGYHTQVCARPNKVVYFMDEVASFGRKLCTPFRDASINEYYDHSSILPSIKQGVTPIKVVFRCVMSMMMRPRRAPTFQTTHFVAPDDESSGDVMHQCRSM